VRVDTGPSSRLEGRTSLRQAGIELQLAMAMPMPLAPNVAKSEDAPPPVENAE